jgi:hypothetical protein
MSDETPAWRRLTEAELRDLAPYALHVEGLPDDAVRQIELDYLRTFGRSVNRVLHHFGRMPTQQEAEVLAKIALDYINRVSIPLLRGRGHASLH